MESAFEDLLISDRKIIVAIDFGTTYSGVAWAETQRHDRRTAITSWPISQTIRDGKTSEKVPTKLRYTNNGNSEWGFQVPLQAPQNEVHEWFKLDLDDTLKPANGILPRGNNKNPQKLVADYLSKLGEHLQYTLRQKLGRSLVDSIPFEFILTVPAIWTELASQRTLEACQQAGGIFKDALITLISEPEAAAIFSLHGLDPHGLKIGDSFVICDAGGGTVDLISYTITKLRPILEVKEAAAGSGALCGSTFLNRRFEAFLRARIGKLVGFDEEIVADAMERFEEQTKRHFTMAALPNDTFQIPVPGLGNNKSLGIQRGRMFLKAQELQQIFEPVVLQIIDLVKGQIASSEVPIRAVLMVGGFGSSTYLRERLRNALDRNIEIMQPPNAWLAVVNGAVMKGLALSSPGTLTAVDIKDRVARKHYGTELEYAFVKVLHNDYDSKKIWDGRDGEWKMPLMKWFIKRGETVSENSPHCYDFRHVRAVDRGRVTKVTLNIYQSTNVLAPVIIDEGASLLCRVEADVSHIPESELNIVEGKDGKRYYELQLTIETVYLSKLTAYTLIHNGQRYKTVTAEYV
ncbi:hypothetical protein BX600DRAFT_139920 [Xylariales sp. PMI_506]|nr:hypothetical protein BX600DRAFT_139920 [Xylariales sp. PMI_506]